MAVSKERRDAITRMGKVTEAIQKIKKDQEDAPRIDLENIAKSLADRREAILKSTGEGN